jgi:hypothetical protein
MAEVRPQGHIVCEDISALTFNQLFFTFVSIPIDVIIFASYVCNDPENIGCHEH